MLTSFFYMLLFLFKLPFYSANLAIEESRLNCSSYKDCFNCSSSREGKKSCLWSNGSCKDAFEVPFITNWFETFADCENDPKSLQNSLSFCSNTETDSLPLHANLNLHHNIYGTPNTYCMWVLNNIDSSKHISIRLKKSDESVATKDEYALQVKHTDNTDQITIMENKTYSVDESKAVKIIFRYYGRETKFEQPFLLEIKYSKGITCTKKIVGCILLGLTIICIIICVFIKCWNRKISQNVNVTRTTNNNLTNESVQVENESYEQKKEKKIIENIKKLLLVKFPPEKYNKNLNCFGNCCTICLDKFENEEKVIKLKCMHIFHAKCLIEWYKKGQIEVKCPNCNIKLLKDDSKHNSSENNHNDDITNNNNVSEELSEPNNFNENSERRTIRFTHINVERNQNNNNNNNNEGEIILTNRINEIRNYLSINNVQRRNNRLHSNFVNRYLFFLNENGAISINN